MQTALYLVIGIAIVYFLPYIRRGLQDVEAANGWHAWPKFELRYLTGFILAVIALGMSVLMSPPLWAELVALPWWIAIGFASGGTFIGDKARKSGGSVIAKIRHR